MTNRIGLELGPRTIRAVKAAGWPRPKVRVLEVPWDPERPAAGIAMVREQFGRARQLAAAVDLSLLRVKRLKLPPLPLAERRRVLGLEPDRFFAVRGEDLVFALREEDDLVFAAPESLVAAWIEALQELGPLERLEPSPSAIARALGGGRHDRAYLLRNGDYDGDSVGAELLEFADGRPLRVRRLYGPPAEAVAELLKSAERSGASGKFYLTPWNEERARELASRTPELEPQPLPELGDVDTAFLAAYGATISPQRDWRAALLTPELERRIEWRRRAQLGMAVAACAAALVFALFSLNASRARAERALDERIASLQERASGVLELQARADALARELGALAQIEAVRPDPLSGLMRLTQRLPQEAWIRSIHADNSDWEINGYAKDAAALIPLFENDPGIEDVRFISATSRAQISGETYENFALALRAVRAP